MRSRTQKHGWLVVLLIFLCLIIDQCVKVWIKTHMMIGDEVIIFDWFRIYFVENPGMAYGLKLGNKLFLTLFRVVAMVGVGGLLVSMLRHRQQYSLGFCAMVGLIFAGGVGNLIDSIFYGALFGSSVGEVASFLPAGGGYTGWFEGYVVDMLYFPLFTTRLPSWLPLWGGMDYTFFSPIFNIADSCITVGTLALIFFYPRRASRALDRLWLYIRGRHKLFHRT